VHFQNLGLVGEMKKHNMPRDGLDHPVSDLNAFLLPQVHQFESLQFSRTRKLAMLFFALVILGLVIAFINAVAIS